jgi:integration host factor subunit alpha
MAMTKKDIVEKIRNRVGILGNEFESIDRCAEVTEILLELIKKTLESGEDILISGFGKFCVKDKSKRKGRDPSTGNDLILPSRRVVLFKCSGKLRDRVNSKS